MSELANKVTAYAERVCSTIALTDASRICELAEAISSTRNLGGMIYVIGNGGSASTASHFVNDLTMVGVRDGRRMRVSALTDCASLVSGIANDVSFEDVFALQLRAMAEINDLVIIISASGNSPNLLRAVDYAESAKLITAGIVGFDGGELARRVDIVVHTPTALGDYGPAEDAHLFVNHAVADLLALPSG